MSIISSQHQIVNIIFILMFFVSFCNSELSRKTGAHFQSVNSQNSLSPSDLEIDLFNKYKNNLIKSIHGRRSFQPLIFYESHNDNAKNFEYSLTKARRKSNTYSVANKVLFNNGKGRTKRTHRPIKIKRNSNNGLTLGSKNSLGLTSIPENISIFNETIVSILSQLLNVSTDVVKKATLSNRNIKTGSIQNQMVQNASFQNCEPYQSLDDTSMTRKSKLSVPPSLGTCKPSLSSALADLNEPSTRVQCYQTDVNIDEILMKVLQKLESMQNCKGSQSKISSTGSTGTDEKGNKENKDDKEVTTKKSVIESTTAATQPEDAPCNLEGSWNSHILGLRFIFKATENTNIKDNLTGKNIQKLRTEILRKKRKDSATNIDVTITEKHPPKNHEIMDTKWNIMGSTLNVVGGPFYLYAKKENEKLMGTFLGYCRTCGGVDTIFGSWSFVFPSKDCQDISTAVQNRRDILRRDRLEDKLKDQKRFKKFKSSRLLNNQMQVPKNCEEVLSSVLKSIII